MTAGLKTVLRNFMVPGGLTIVRTPIYLHGLHTSFNDGVNWDKWRGEYYSLKKTEMKIRHRS